MTDITGLKPGKAGIMVMPNQEAVDAVYEAMTTLLLSPDDQDAQIVIDEVYSGKEDTLIVGWWRDKLDIRHWYAPI